MVGYNANDSLTKTQKLLVGCLSGISTKFITQPMDVIKIRSQLLRKPQQRFATYKVARRILWEEGITAFWHGHLLGQVYSVLGVSSQFYVYEVSTQLTSTVVPRKYQHIEHFFCGVLAGCVCTTLIIPLEVIRVRQMLVKDQYRSVFHGAKAVYRYGGIRAFYEGLSASLLQMGPQVGIQFATFSAVQPLILSGLTLTCDHHECQSQKRKIANLAIASSLAGSLAGFMAKSITYPFDLAKRRLQISTHRTDLKYKTPTQAQKLIRCQRLLECLVRAYQIDGFLGLYRGWAVTVYKAQLTSVAAFTSYELMCYAVRQYNEGYVKVPTHYAGGTAGSLLPCGYAAGVVRPPALAAETEYAAGLVGSMPAGCPTGIVRRSLKD